MCRGSADYKWGLLGYCAQGEHKRFGVIEDAQGVDVTSEFKAAVAEVEEGAWQRLYRRVEGKLEETVQEWAEVCFVPNQVGCSLRGPMYRFLFDSGATGTIGTAGGVGSTAQDCDVSARAFGIG